VNSDSPKADAPPARVTPNDIQAAHARIAPHIRRTPLLETASPIAGAPPVSLKLECLQHSGSFKARGAFHNLLTRPAPAAGCATASGGNHGTAVAYAAQQLGLKASIFVPDIASPRWSASSPKDPERFMQPSLPADRSTSR
jgi:threonine dehydratase